MKPLGRVDNRVLRTGAYLIMAIAGVIGLLQVSELADNANKAAEDAKEAVTDANDAIESVERQGKKSTLEICKQSNTDRSVILRLVENVAAGSGGSDLSQVEGFDKLDPELQAFLLNLSAPQDNSGPPTENRLVKVARELLVQQDCEAIANTEGA